MSGTGNFAIKDRTQQFATRSRNKQVFVALFLCLLCLPASLLADSQILIVTSSNSSFKEQVSDTIQQQLSTSYKTEIMQADELDENNIANKELVITIGKNSVTILRKNSYRTAVIDALKDASADDRDSRYTINQSRIHMDQPLCRQFRLIKTLGPDWKSVGLLLSEKNDVRASALSACGRKYGLKINTVTVNNETILITALNTVLSSSDVLLSLPDPVIYNSLTIKNILLTTYRHRLPIIGFSESFVNAGAIAAVHTSAQQLGTQVANIVRDYYKNNKTFSRSEYYPSDFSISVNRQVAHALEITLPPSDAIAESLRIMEPGNE